MGRRNFLKETGVGAVVAGLIGGTPGKRPNPERELQAITLNTGPYEVQAHSVDQRSENIVAEEDMHIVAIEHFIGVGGGGLSDNGHILSQNPDNPWTKWPGTAMEPTGTKGYFGYCGRDYYSEVSGISDVLVYESFPTGYFLLREGERLFMHCYASNFTDAPRFFHHAVRLIYW
ncbi:MAG TPA: twin-arginine translocation signal domain-containing protein [Armatimonadetes bacterium]|nr:twin-arginine translocation signal domain-containing protein [Armatimonadota bacterium]